MESNGKLFPKGFPVEASALLGRYHALSDNGFPGFDGLTDEEMDWIQRIHDKHLAFYQEERRMHFGAFALVGLAMVLLLPAVLAAEEHFIPLVAAFGLLLILLLPYTYVYMRYEEGVRKKMRESVIIENERRLRRERQKEETI